MDANLGHETDALSFLSAVSKEPYRYDFYQTLRRLECLYESRPRWGTALRPIDEPVRLGQEPELSFAPAPLASLEFGSGGAPPRLHVRLFGLLGPNGPMPTYLTEYTRHRLRHSNDPTLSRFLDLLHHRFIALFYRAWAQAQPHVNRDRSGQDRFRTYIGTLNSLAPSSVRDRDSVLDVARLFHAGTLVRQVRNAEGLSAIVQQFFGVPARVEQFVGHWMRLASADLTRLARRGSPLGQGAVAGARVWDHQSKFRIHLGPLTLAQYKMFLPRPAGSAGEQPSHLRKLVDWVRFYLCFELDWDVRLHLRCNEVPALALGRAGQLGWTTWLGRRRSTGDAADLVLDAETFVKEKRLA
jgi:type VI secretion system protein ImpH